MMFTHLTVHQCMSLGPNNHALPTEVV